MTNQPPAVDNHAATFRKFCELVRQGEPNDLGRAMLWADAELSRFQDSEFHPDWSMLQACRESLNEHQKLMKQWRDAIARLAEAESDDESTAALTDLLEMTGLLQDTGP